LRSIRTLGASLLTSVGLISTPEPINAVAISGGAGGLTGTSLDTGSNLDSGELATIGVVGALPGAPGNMRTNRTSKSIDAKKLAKRYDDALLALRSRRAKEARLEALEGLKPILYELSPEIKAWTGDTRLRIYLLVQEVLKDVADPRSANAALGLLTLVLSKGGRSALEMLRPMVRDKIVAMYGESGYQSERFLPRVMLMLDDYNLELVEQVTKDAIHCWSDERFRAAGPFLGLDELKEKETRNKLKDMLGGEIAAAGVQRDPAALNRAVELYHEVK